MSLKLFLDLLSQPCRAVYIFAKKNGIPLEMRTVELFKGQHLSHKFLQVNSLQRLPTLQDGDFVLTESVAILIFLSAKYQTADHWYPADLQARARIHEYLGWHADCIRGTFGVPPWTQVIMPLTGTQVPEEKVRRNRTAMDQALQQLEDKFLGNRAFLTSQQPVAVGCDVFEGRPRLAAWRERVETFLGAGLCQEAHGPILNILERAASKTFLVTLPEAYPFVLRHISRIP
ncbi:PREDICTED: glutathione S-transferase theta-2B-like isoform X2 [Ceratotherium simum simum]|uniref:Glutathione S-transferase theta-2B-like isoform X2 n=1 Tax=Ceratotherium simum simum TaxID=73337 RepID=A0ABM1DM02_CERSS|nr:PREDICTED: glutathione S-transferase theta-2B-like isoform X2 [Ceratotherium simum simum]